MCTPSLVSRASKSGPSKHASDEIPNLDFLRAVAVLLVLLSHLISYRDSAQDLGPLRLNWMGALGVDFFFVHTCFVLMLSLERQWKGQGGVQLFGSFIIRRIFRIYPLSIASVVLIVTFRLPQAQLSQGHFSAASPNLAMIVSNLMLVQGYGRSILGVMWSLPYEMAVYLLLPWLFLWLYFNKSLWSVIVVWFISVLGGVTFLIYSGWPNRRYFFLYIPCFLSGVIAYQLQRTRHGRLPALIWPVVVIGVVPIYLYRYKDNFMSDYRLKAWLVCLLLGVTAPFFARMTNEWITRPAHFIAKYSYGVYLTHCFCIWFCFERLHGILPRVVRLGLFAALLAGLPLLFYHMLEEPLILVGKHVSRRFEEIAARSKICQACSFSVRAANCHGLRVLPLMKRQA
jgi:peptidoglycan/LPS O-acetylase OafA/YrhL